MKQKKYKGSQRCMLELISSQDFLLKINSIIQYKGALISKEDIWYPRGLSEPKEAELKDFLKSTWTPDLGDKIADWWLAARSKNSRTPNWDFISTCAINGKKGLVLVEAKAHRAELESLGKKLKKHAPENSVKNHEKIREAICEAKIKICKSFPEVSISRDKCYQLSNRIAHAWWLANNGIPVVLVYLGFLNAEDMNTGGRVIFKNTEDWDDCFTSHAKRVGVDKMLEKWIDCEESKFITICRSI